MTITATQKYCQCFPDSVEADAAVKAEPSIDMTPPDSEEAAETGSNDETFTSLVRMKSDFSDDVNLESITVDEKIKLTSLPMIYLQKVAIPILRHLDINIASMRITSSFVMLSFPRGDQFELEDLRLDLIDNYQGRKAEREG